MNFRDGLNRQYGAREYVEGWRDQECPVCGERWFINASRHVTAAHGLRIPGRSSTHYRNGKRDQYDRQRALMRNADPSRIRAHWRRWAAVVQEEQERGGHYMKRLAIRWKISVKGVESRLRTLQKHGLIERNATGTCSRWQLPEER